jgi:hypothetical protein
MLLGYVFLGLIIASIIGAIGIRVLGKQFDRESRAFVDAAVPAIVSDWDVQELEKRASPEFDSSINYDDVEQYFSELRKLGRLVAYKGATGDSTITVSLRYWYEITADYTAIADFETGSAEFQVTLIRLNGQWQILDFRISPEEFSKRKDVI